jgi:hypothetical protein
VLDQDDFKPRTEIHCFNPGPLHSNPFNVTNRWEEHFLIKETGESYAVTTLRDMADTPKLSYFPC